MDKVRCDSCGNEHDLSEMEPSYTYPDAYLTVPPDERATRAVFGADECELHETAAPSRYFLRVLLPMPVRGEHDACAWGVWAEVSESTFAHLRTPWSDTSTATVGASAATLANALTGYAATLGLPGEISVTTPDLLPTFMLAGGLDHPLARDQRDGVHPERVVEWLFAHLH